MSTSEALAQRVESAHREVVRLRRQFRRGMWITLIVGILLLGLLSGYFAFGYSEISQLMKPDTLVPWLGDMLDARVREAIPALEAEVVKNAPEWAEQVSQQVVAYAPTAREILEKELLEATGKFVSEHTVMAENEFKNVLKKHHATIQDTLDQLATKQDPTKDLLAPLQAALESELKIEMETQAKELLAGLIEMEVKLRRLREGVNLDHEEKIERQILMIARRMQNEQAGQAGPPAPARPQAPKVNPPPAKSAAAPASAGKSGPPPGGAGKP